MKKLYIGIDSGSTFCKSVLFDGENILDINIQKTGWDANMSALESIKSLAGRNNIDQEQTTIIATGYGRESVDFADYSFTEITCHALGGVYLAPDVQGVIDIGGQDSKVIQVENGKVANFLMNDKCAAGTGRFLQMACDKLDIEFSDIDSFAGDSEAAAVNSMCAVFAESEIIGLLAMRVERAKIVRGVVNSIAQRIRQQTGKLNFFKETPLLMTGGLSSSNLLVTSIAAITGHTVVSHKYALYAGAIGACISVTDKNCRGQGLSAVK